MIPFGCWVDGCSLDIGCWVFVSVDCGTNLLFVGECVRVVMLVVCMLWRSGLVVQGMFAV